MKRLVYLVFVVPLAVLLIVLSVANRQSVRLALNPFQPDDGMLSLSAPFFVFLFLAVALGIVIGSTATWLAQGKYRKRARSEARSAVKWQAEADRNKNVGERSVGESLARLPAK